MGERPTEAVTPQVFLEVKGGGPLVWRSCDPAGAQLVKVVVKMRKCGSAYLCWGINHIGKPWGKVGQTRGGSGEESDLRVSWDPGDQLNIISP